MQCQQDYEQQVQDGVVKPTPTPPIEPTKTQRCTKFDKLMSDTHHQLKDETIIHALLTPNMSQCLIKQCQIIDKLNYSECDGDQIDANGEAFSMECQGLIYEEGIIPHYAIAWCRGSCHVVQHETKCGNCPMCFKAMPLGMHCYCRG